VKLTDLNPRWFTVNVAGHPKRHGIGLTFDCPHCRKVRLCVAFKNPLDGKEPVHISGGFDGVGHTDFGAEPLWQRTGDTFETLTLWPSVDVSKHGHWHGFVTNGAIR